MRGGYRPGSGRPKGARNKATNPLPHRGSAKAIRKERIADVQLRAQSWLDGHEDKLLRDIMKSPDLRLKFEVYKFIKGYSDGVAPKAIDLRIHNDFESAMAEVAERAQRNAVTVAVLPSYEVLALPEKSDAA